MLVSFHQTILKMCQSGFRNSPLGSGALWVISLPARTEVLPDFSTIRQEDKRTEGSTCTCPHHTVVVQGRVDTLGNGLLVLGGKVKVLAPSLFCGTRGSLISRADPRQAACSHLNLGGKHKPRGTINGSTWHSRDTKNIQNVLPWANPGSEQRERCPTCEQKQGAAGTPDPSSELHTLSWLAWGGAGLQMGGLRAKSILSSDFGL